MTVLSREYFGFQMSWDIPRSLVSSSQSTVKTETRMEMEWIYANTHADVASFARMRASIWFAVPFFPFHFCRALIWKCMQIIYNGRHRARVTTGACRLWQHWKCFRSHVSECIEDRWNNKRKPKRASNKKRLAIHRAFVFCSRRRCHFCFAFIPLAPAERSFLGNRAIFSWIRLRCGCVAAILQTAHGSCSDRFDVPSAMCCCDFPCKPKIDLDTLFAKHETWNKLNTLRGCNTNSLKRNEIRRKPVIGCQKLRATTCAMCMLHQLRENIKQMIRLGGRVSELDYTRPHD